MAGLDFTPTDFAVFKVEGFNERMQQIASRPGSSLWRRMMVLGPPPEFCLVSSSETDLPSEFRPEMLLREPI